MQIVKWLKFAIFFTALLVLTACAPLRYTLNEIKSNPQEYSEEAKRINDALPLGDSASLPVGIALGYGLSFLRRLYVNWRKLKKGGV